MAGGGLGAHGFMLKGNLPDAHWGRTLASAN